MDFTSKGFKSLFTDVTTVFTRAKQYAEETIGTAERTELDQQYESLAERADIYKQWTERIVAKLEAVIQPNPNMRYGDLLIEKMGTEIKRDRLRNLEYLGNDMIDAGIAFGPSTVYGGALVKVGKTQQSLGQAEKDFVLNSYRTFIIPFRKFLDEDMKTIAKERKVLETKRLDLDAAKNRLRKAKNMDTQSNPKIKPEMIEKEIEEAEKDLKHAQDEFERQIEITKLLLEGLSSAQANHVRCLTDFVNSQIEFYNQCYRHMLNLQREISYSNNYSHRAQSFSGVIADQNVHYPSYLNSVNSNSVMNSSSRSSTATLPTTATISATNSSVISHHQNAVNHSAAAIEVGSSVTEPTDDMLSSDFVELPDGKRRARCLNDYKAQNSSELTLRANEIILVCHSAELDPEWMLAERTAGVAPAEKGKVPVAYLEILN